jgi:hypothetical protein
MNLSSAILMVVILVFVSYVQVLAPQKIVSMLDCLMLVLKTVKQDALSLEVSLEMLRQVVMSKPLARNNMRDLP